MKKIVFFTFFVLTIATCNKAIAQFNFYGGGLALATGGEYKYNGLPYYNNSFGIEIRASYDYNKKIKIVPDLKLYLPNKEVLPAGGESKTTVFVFNLNAHYVVNPRSDYKLYVLAGAHVGGWNITDNRILSFGSLSSLDIKEFKIVPGGNLGGGMQFKLSYRVQFYAEVKYVIAKANQLVFSPGILYEF